MFQLVGSTRQHCITHLRPTHISREIQIDLSRQSDIDLSFSENYIWRAIGDFWDICAYSDTLGVVIGMEVLFEWWVIAFPNTDRHWRQPNVGDNPGFCDQGGFARCGNQEEAFVLASRAKIMKAPVDTGKNRRCANV